MGQKDKAKIEAIQKTARLVEDQSCLSCVDDRRLCEAHFPRAQSGGRRTLARKGRERSQLTKGDNTENWKAVRGFWDGSNKSDGRSGCGVVT